MSRPRGIVLIVVLGTLVLMALLATSFVTLQTVEGRITHNYTDDVRAKLVAQSGVDFAIDRLQEIVRRGWFVNGRMDRSWFYFGGQTDETRSPDLLSPLERALNPSFAWEDESTQNPSDPNTTPKRIRVEGQEIGFSNVVGGTYIPYGDLFSVKVLDAQSMINVNDGEEWGPSHSVSQNVRRILNVLGDQPALQGWKLTASDKLGDLLISNRPPGGYASKWELLRLFGNDAQRFAPLRNHLTCQSWRNPHVANPVPLSAAALAAYPAEISYLRPLAGGSPIFRYGNGLNRQGVPIPQPLNFYSAMMPDSMTAQPLYCAVFTHDALNPQWIEVVKRAPVNVNTAGPEVLTALIMDVEGFFLSSRRRPAPVDMFYKFIAHSYRYQGSVSSGESVGESRCGELGFLYRTVPFTGSGSRWPSPAVDTLSAEFLAREIVSCRERKVSALTGVDYAQVSYGGPFRSWAQFNIFVDSLVAPGGLIWDRRPIFLDYTGTATYPPVTLPGQGEYVCASPMTVVSKDPTVSVWGGGGPGAYTLTFSGTGDFVLESSPNCPMPVQAQGQFGWTAISTVLLPGNIWRVTGHLENYQSTLPPVTTYSMGDSFVQRWHASMAAADALKANFNPNLHLNELNPDRNLYLRVDKTDLIVNSTELCFVPMGIFEIESHGKVLRNNAPMSSTVLEGSLGPLETEDNRVVAQKTVGAYVRLYEAAHITAQSQFYLGDLSERQSSPALTTNNNRSVETGPEPDNGPAPMECGWDGYISLPTRLGALQGSSNSALKPKGALWTSYRGSDQYQGLGRAPAGASEFGESIHAHFTYDHCPEFHAGGIPYTVPVGPNPVAGEPSLNFPDKSETRRGPYGPVDSMYSDRANKYRLCRSFLTPPTNGAAPSPPALFAYAPSDLRLDGAYKELHSCVGIRLANERIHTNGVISFWYKPNFFPEQMGKIRALVTAEAYGQSNRPDGLLISMPFSAYLMPSWHSTEYDYPAYDGLARPKSIVWGLGMWNIQPLQGGGIGCLSQTLNHEFEPQTSTAEDASRFFGRNDNRWNELRGREWCHIILVCEAGEGPGASPPPPAMPPRLRIFVNGKLNSLDPDIRVHVKDGPTDPSIFHGSTLWLGGVSSEAGSYVRNYFADGTIDEFFMWRDSSNLDAALNNAKTIYTLGRYLRPSDANPADAVFTSAPLTLSFPARVLSRTSSIAPPPGEPGSTTTQVPESRMLYVIGVCWTALAEDYGTGSEADGTPRIKPVLWNYRPQLANPSATPLPCSPANFPDANGYSYETVCDMSILVGAAAYGPYRSEGWSPVKGSDGAPVAVSPSDSCRFKAKLRIGPTTPDSILLATPVLDDVTVFYAEEAVRFLSYVEVRN
jgi:hypothetical protein